MEQSAERALLFFSSSGPDLKPTYGNPSSIHWAGRAVKSAVDDARDQVAEAFGIEDSESICFTGSATESINTALKGLFFLAQKEGKKFHLITSAVEHDATLESAKFLLEMGAKVDFLPVNSQGEIDLDHLKEKLKDTKGITLVSLMAANNETGVIFPWEEAAKIAKDHEAYFHLDAVQAPGKIPGFALNAAPVDLASFSAHKIGGSKGVGALMVKRGVKLVSLLHGGAQEKKRRAGTINVAGIAAFGAAAKALKDKNLEAINEMRQFLEKEVKAKISGVHVQGERAKRIVNTSNFLFDGVRGESLLMGLDIEGYAVSSGSACNSGTILPSHVLMAMGFDKIAAQSAVRVSLGPTNTLEELHGFVESLAKVVQRIRSKN